MAKKYSEYRRQLAKEYRKQYNKFYQRYKYWQTHQDTAPEYSYFSKHADKVQKIIENRSIAGLEAKEVQKKLRDIINILSKKTTTVKGAKHLEEFISSIANVDEDDRKLINELYNKFLEDGTIWDKVKYEAREKLTEMVIDNVPIDQIQAELQKFSDNAYYEFVKQFEDEPIYF